MRINGDKIDLRLAELGITKAALAERCGLCRQNLSTIIRRGTCEPKTAGKLAKGLGLEVSDIIEGVKS